jgi:hypothetical protein
MWRNGARNKAAPSPSRNRQLLILMKSAYELAMERLEKNAPTQTLTDAQKAEIAEIESLARSKIAERELFLRGEIAKTQAAGQVEEVAKLEDQLARDVRRLTNEAEEKKERVRSGAR